MGVPAVGVEAPEEGARGGEDGVVKTEASGAFGAAGTVAVGGGGGGGSVRAFVCASFASPPFS